MAIVRRKSPVVVGMLVVSLALGGCSQTVIHRAAPYETGAKAVAEPAPATGLYKVKIALPSGQTRNERGSIRYIEQGQTVGFTTTEQGTVQALAGDEVVAVDAPPGSRLVWYMRYQQPSKLAEDCRQALRTTGQVVLLCAVVVLIVAAACATSEAEHDHHHCDGW